jgi:hypothetical protein
MTEPEILKRWLPGNKGDRDHYRELVTRWLASPDVTIKQMMELCRWYSTGTNELVRKITKDKGGYR